MSIVHQQKQLDSREQVRRTKHLWSRSLFFWDFLDWGHEISVFLLIFLHFHLFQTEQLPNQLNLVCVIVVADENFLDPVDHKYQTAPLEDFWHYILALILFVSVLLQDMFLLKYWQLRMASLGSNRQNLFFIDLLVISPYKMFVDENHQVPVLNESLLADPTDIERDVNFEFSQCLLSLFKIETVFVLVQRICDDS